MKTIIALILSCSLISAAQTAKAPAKIAAQPATTTAKPAPSAGASALVTGEEVDSFLKHMFGFQPGLTMKVGDIGPVPEAPGVTRVLVQFGDQTQALYVLPGGKFAMAGDMIPFGADPFEPVRSKLAGGAFGAMRGSKDAPVTIVEFTDLQCPHCKTAQPFVEKLIAEAPNAKLIYQPFPLPFHAWAKKAAAYAECVHQQNADAMWKFTDSVYEAQSEISEANATEKLNGLVRAVGSDADSAQACAAKPETEAKVQKSIDLGLSVGVNSTPTLFIEGRRVLGINNEALPSLKAMIDFEAKQAKQ